MNLLKSVKIVRKIFYWVIPFIIFIIIFSKIDIVEFKIKLAQANPWLVFGGICYFPLALFIGAVRWWVLLKHSLKRSINIQFILKHYWIGLGLGAFAPASSGWDIYRIVISGKKFGSYVTQTAIIFIEKIMALIVCTSTVIIVYPFIDISYSDQLDHILKFVHILFFITITCVVFTILLIKMKQTTFIIDKINNIFTGMIIKSLLLIKKKDINHISDFSIKKVLLPLITTANAIPTILLSFSNLFIAAFGSQLFFRALGYDLPFLVNLFLIPIFFFLFLLPISFGSLGIREGSYIMLYGFFGVPAETALLVSFFSLTGILMNIGIGGLIMMASGVRESKEGHL